MSAVAIEEFSILFKGPMVRAINCGRKTQTRRVIDRLKGYSKIRQFERSDTPGYDWHFRCKRGLWHDMRESQVLELCPYGKPGDRLWVRENWEPVEFDNGCIGVVYEATPSTEYGLNAIHWYSVGEDEMLKWQLRRRRRFPSIHMPRWASRITIEVTDVRVDRLNDISRGDCMSEGCPFQNLARQTDPVGWYKEVWESLNGEGSWDANPYVWAIEFKRCE